MLLCPLQGGRGSRLRILLFLHPLLNMSSCIGWDRPGQPCFPQVSTKSSALVYKGEMECTENSSAWSGTLNDDDNDDDFAKYFFLHVCLQASPDKAFSDNVWLEKRQTLSTTDSTLDFFIYWHYNLNMQPSTHYAGSVIWPIVAVGWRLGL